MTPSVRDPLAVLTARIDDAHGLMSCVHCGFCLPACPTYRRLGDEADSPRGRLHLMRAVAEGRLDAGSDAFQVHLDRCLGCRACEPVCPSGVPYGHLLEEARAVAVAARTPGWMSRGLLAVFGSTVLSALAGFAGRLARATPIPAWLARHGPGRAVRTASAMLVATRPEWRSRIGDEATAADAETRGEATRAPATPATPNHGSSTEAALPVRLLVLEGCVQRGLFGRVNDATVRVLDANGYRAERWNPGCCGALHAHAGAVEEARARARRSVAAFEASGADGVAMNAAGCGAAMRDYGTLLRDDPEWAGRAGAFSSKVRDVTEWLADRGPREGGALRTTVAYDPPCHLLHAQGVDAPVDRVFAAIPGLETRTIQRAEECCGGAGIYGLTHPELGGRIGGDKIAAVRATGARICATGNPGCMMQIGAGLLAEEAGTSVAHPIELLDESYRRGGVYDSKAGGGTTR